MSRRRQKPKKREKRARDRGVLTPEGYVLPRGRVVRMDGYRNPKQAVKPQARRGARGK